MIRLAILLRINRLKASLIRDELGNVLKLPWNNMLLEDIENLKTKLK